MRIKLYRRGAASQIYCGTYLSREVAGMVRDMLLQGGGARREDYEFEAGDWDAAGQWRPTADASTEERT